MPVSFIVCTKDNSKDCINTCESLSSIMSVPDELIVVSGSSDEHFSKIQEYLKTYKVKNKTLLWCEPAGIYNAINIGIKNSSNDWINIIHSGDIALLGSASSIVRATTLFDSQVIIFDQLYGPTLESAVRLRSKKHKKIFPHQSIFYKKSLHDEFGYYDETAFASADHKFFNKVAIKFPPHYEDVVYCFYNTLGVSSKFSIHLTRSALKDCNSFSDYVITIVKAIVKAVLGFLGDDYVHFARRVKNRIKEKFL
jgi:glycosyltransferase involved in cell wall biosynthesis